MISQMDKSEIIMAWKRGDSARKIARDAGLSRNTVASYVEEYKRSEAAIEACEDPAERAEIQKARGKIPWGACVDATTELRKHDIIVAPDGMHKALR